VVVIEGRTGEGFIVSRVVVGVGGVWGVVVVVVVVMVVVRVVSLGMGGGRAWSTIRVGHPGKEAEERRAPREGSGMRAWAFVEGGGAKKIVWCTSRRTGQREGQHVRRALVRT